MRVYDRECFADEGKMFVTEKENLKGIVENNWAPKWAVDDGSVKEIPIPGWRTDLKGYKVGYYHKGTFLHCGNPQTFPTEKAAEIYAKHYASYPWFDEEIVIEETTYSGVPLSKPKYYNGKEVVDKEHYFGLDAHEIGSYFTSEMVQDFMDMLPPACYRSDCAQIGEPTSHRIDENGNEKPTFPTFKRIAESIWEYCGDCFRGENVIAGKEIAYV